MQIPYRNSDRGFALTKRAEVPTESLATENNEIICYKQRAGYQVERDESGEHNAESKRDGHWNEKLCME